MISPNGSPKGISGDGPSISGLPAHGPSHNLYSISLVLIRGGSFGDATVAVQRGWKPDPNHLDDGWVRQPSILIGPERALPVTVKSYMMTIGVMFV